MMHLKCTDTRGEKRRQEMYVPINAHHYFSTLPAVITGREAAEGGVGESLCVRHGFQLPAGPTHSVFQARHKVSIMLWSVVLLHYITVDCSMSAWAHEQAMRKLEAEEAAAEPAASD